MKNQFLAAIAVIIVLTACYVNVGNASPQASVTLQSSGTIGQENSAHANFGDSNIEADPNVLFPSYFESAEYTLNPSGTVSSITAYLTKDGSYLPTVSFGLYIDNGAGYPNTLEGYTSQWNMPSNFTSGWVTLNLISPVNLGVSNYWLVIWTNNYLTVYLGIAQAGGYSSTLGFYNLEYGLASTYGTFPNTFPAGGTTDANFGPCSIYATYTPSASSPTPTPSPPQTITPTYISAPQPYTVVERGIDIASFSPPADIYAYVANFVGNNSFANAVTISDMHMEGILFFGYSFSPITGTWMGWTFDQIEQLNNAFHSFGWKVGLECTGIAYQGETMYNYIETQQPELAFTNGNGVLASVSPGYNDLIVDPFAIWNTTDTVNNIPAGSRVIDVYTTRLTEMIEAGLSWDFWFGTDGWNGLNNEGYSWDSSNSAACYSFSREEINEWAAANGITSSNTFTTYNILGTSSPTASDNIYGGGTMCATVFQCTATGTLNALNVYTIAQNGANVQAAIYSGTSTAPESLLGQTNIVAVPASNAPGWYTFTLTSPVNVTAGTYYWLSYEGDNDIGFYYGGFSGAVANSNTFGTFPDSFGSSSSVTASLTIFSTYNYQTLLWGAMSATQQASYIINNRLSSWNQYWQVRFAEMYAQIKQAFINAGEPPNTFHTMGSADQSSEPDGSGNLAPAGMYNMTDMAQYNSLDYIYVDCESTAWGASTYDLGPQQAFVSGIVKLQNPSLNPIIGLQPVNWLSVPDPLWEVEQEYVSQAINYVWYDGTQYQVSAPNVIMLQYPNSDGSWTGWTSAEMNTLFSFINSTVASLHNATPVWLGPTYQTPDNYLNYAWLNMNYSVAQWVWSDSYSSDQCSSSMNTILSGATLPWSGTTESRNSQMYSACNCPITPSQSLIDLKIYSSDGKILIPMTDQYDVGDSFTIPSSISTTLTINTTALGLTQPAQDYSVYWQSNPNTLMPLSSSGSVTVTLNGGADVLIISPT